MNNDPQSQPEKQGDLSFEAAFARLEEILEKMNSSTVSLDESLRLYEEADRLINLSSKKLVDAERKIEMLVKSRNGELTIGTDQKPMMQDMPNMTQKSDLG